MPGPIKPSEVQNLKEATIPEAVFEAFNELIVKNWSTTGACATVRQKDVISAILSKIEGEITGQDICNLGWLDIEAIYRKEGWKVEYDKPGYNESYEATFTFRKKK